MAKHDLVEILRIEQGRPQRSLDLLRQRILRRQTGGLPTIDTFREPSRVKAHFPGSSRSIPTHPAIGQAKKYDEAGGVFPRKLV